jgi:hypothetical protein
MLKSSTRDSNESTVQTLSDHTEQTTSQPVWNTLNNLLLLQAIYHYGDDRWPTVSRILRQHRLITQPEALTPKVFAIEDLLIFIINLIDQYIELRKAVQTFDC